MKTTTKRVTGDWLPEDHPGYEAEVEAVRWNGWAVPRFTEEVARQVVADQEALLTKAAQDGSDLTEWDALEIVSEDPLVIEHQSGPVDDNEYETIIAGTDGLFAIGGWCWCWYETDHYEEA